MLAADLGHIGRDFDVDGIRYARDKAEDSVQPASFGIFRGH
jgi:hypothetical protein